MDEKDKIMLSDINRLLSRSEAIYEKYEHVAMVTGERFNLFDILGVASYELSHSSFLAELLNPAGKHGQGDIFLQLFLNQLEMPNMITAVVAREYRIAGGRLDILITGQNQDSETVSIVIENKIYASDQDIQLQRYHNFLVNEEKPQHKKLIYLNLDGKEPDEQSKDTLKEEDYLVISYRNEITSWLERCQQYVSHLPFVRENILQYQRIIQSLTGQASNRIMKEEIKKEINKIENPSHIIQLIKDAYDEWRHGLYKNFISEIFKYLDENVQVQDIEENIKKKDFAILYPSNIAGFQYVLGEDSDGFYWGISHNDYEDKRQLYITWLTINKFKTVRTTMVGWINPASFKIGERIENKISNKQISEAMVKEVGDEIKQYMVSFNNEVSTFKK